MTHTSNDVMLHHTESLTSYIHLDFFSLVVVQVHTGGYRNGGPTIDTATVWTDTKYFYRRERERGEREGEGGREGGREEGREEGRE